MGGSDHSMEQPSRSASPRSPAADQTDADRPSEAKDNESTASQSRYRAKMSRKSHRKSRMGCGVCKRRRVKCGEEKPACTNCIKHHARCDFLPPLEPGSAAAQDTPDDASQAAGSGYILNVQDLELLHHYLTSTMYTMSSEPYHEQYAKVDAPQLGLKYEYVMHSLLALAAIHLARFRHSQVDYYRRLCDFHTELGFRKATADMAHMDDNNCTPLYVFSLFHSTIAMGRGPSPGDYLVYGDHGTPHWIVMFRGCKTILESSADKLRGGILGPMINAALKRVGKNQREAAPKVLLALKAEIADTEGSDPRGDLCLKELDNLMLWPGATEEPGELAPQNGFAWIYHVSDAYVELLQQRYPPALLILSYFCVIIHRMRNYWWLKGWSEHLITKVYADLPFEHRSWIQWPMEQIGWIPDTKH